MNHQYQFEQMEEEAMFATKRKNPMGKRRSKRGLVLTQGTLLVCVDAKSALNAKHTAS
jgi:hypothetical protein